MYAKRISIDEVPEGEDAAAEWLHKLYQQKVIKTKKSSENNR